MQRKEVMVSVILLIIIGCILLWQWLLYINNKEIENDVENGKVSQEIEINVKNKYLAVTQKIVGLSRGKKYEIRIPPVAENMTGLPDENKMSANQDGSRSGTFHAESDTLTVRYEIPFAKNEGPVLLSDWLVEMKNVTVSGTSIEVIDPQKGKGTWVAGLPLTTLQELEHIDHYFFLGGTKKPALYWHPEVLKKLTVAEEKLAIFYEGDRKPETALLKKVENLSNFAYVSLVLTNRFAETEAGGIVIYPEGGEESGDWLWKLANQYFQAKLEAPSENREWAADVLTSLFTGIKAEGEKAAGVLRELEGDFSENELQQFIYMATREKKDLTFGHLDICLSEIKGRKTDFFALNGQSSSKLIPLYFYETRDIYVNGDLKEEIKVVYKEGERFFSAKETFAALSYNVNIVENGKTLLLSKGTRNYRFYVDENIFILNEEHFGLLEQPLRMIDGELFIKEKWLIKIFHCSINDEETHLEIFS